MSSCHNGEGWHATSRLRAFDFTPCFEEGIVLSLLYGALLLFSLGRSVSLFHVDRRERSKKSCRLLTGKLLLLSLAFCVSLGNAIYVSVAHQPVAIFESYTVEPISVAAALLHTYLNHVKTRRSSTILLLFWPLYAVGLVIWTRTMAEVQSLPEFTPVIALKWASAGLGILAWALECVNPDIDFEQVATKEVDPENVENPAIVANVFSIWMFSWMTPLMRKGAKEYVTEQDIPSLRPEDESENLGNKLQDALNKHSFWYSLFVAYGGPFAFALCLKIISDALMFFQPQLLRMLLAFIAKYQMASYGSNVGMFLWPATPGMEAGGVTTRGEAPSSTEGFAIAVLMFLSASAQSIILNQYFQRVFETGMRIRSGIVTAVYNKSLVLSNDERNRRPSGDIVNLMSVDATRLQDFCQFGLILFSGPLQIAFAFASLYDLLGWPAFVGVGVMMVSIPLNTFIANIMKKMQVQQMKNRDKRTGLMNEMLNNMKSIKLYGWEFAFVRKILAVRNDQEIKMLQKIGIMNSASQMLWTGVPLLVAFASFATAATQTDHVLTSDVIFPAIALFNLLQFPLAMFSMVTSNTIEAVVSIKRLSEFLGAEEVQKDARILTPYQDGEEVLSVKKADFSWSKDAKTPNLEGIDLSVKKGELVGVMGRVGCGKSSLMSAIIGEMHRPEGQLIVRGDVAYAPQNPWILSATLRENILFSREYDETYYNLVLEACALGPDLALLSEGDQTQVGEKGITLSGGQRARIALARAVYARAELVLLDDCLAAVDSHVAKHIFTNVIGPKGLLADTARILVTNSVSFVSQFDKIVFMRRGIILEQGPYYELMSNEEGEIAKLVRGHGHSGTTTPHSRSGSATPQLEDGNTSPLTPESIASSTILNEKNRQLRLAKPKIVMPVLKRSSEIPTGLTKEHQEQGSVRRRVYWQYMKAASVAGFVFFLVSALIHQAINVCSTLVLRSWSEYNQEMGENSSTMRYLAYYAILGLVQILLGFISTVILRVYCALKSAKHLHETMLNAIVHAPLLFFEITPTGRIMNLFSRDVYVIDEVLGRIIFSLIRTGSVCIFIVAVICVSFPVFLVFVIPLTWFYMQVMKYFLSTSREVKRLDAVSRSPIFAWFSETLSGISTIRAYEQQAVFNANSLRRLDRNQICYLTSISVNRWLAVRLEFVGNIIILLVALLSVTALVTSGVDAGLVGLVLSYALSATSSLNWVVRSAAEVEQNIVSVERVLHQIDVTPEAPLELPDASPGEAWPSEGEVEFSNYSTRYRPELDLVLKDISMKIKPSEKIGVCGRTGAGKSSLLLALFRIIEPVEGTILIDGVDITKIGLHDLRSSISIVPQQPDLFDGTLRENIDPLGEHPDVDIWTALAQSHLKDYVNNLPEALDAQVGEGGSSLSSGQRQLLCFARALLRKSKVLVLDEATSAVDLETDKNIQDIIHGEAFKNVTILTIAHRLNTILDSDRVLVMDAGKVAEFDSPANLLDNKETIFYHLVNEAGLTGSDIRKA